MLWVHGQHLNDAQLDILKTHVQAMTNKMKQLTDQIVILFVLLLTNTSVFTKYPISAIPNLCFIWYS